MLSNNFAKGHKAIFNDYGIKTLAGSGKQKRDLTKEIVTIRRIFKEGYLLTNWSRWGSVVGVLMKRDLGM